MTLSNIAVTAFRTLRRTVGHLGTTLARARVRLVLAFPPFFRLEIETTPRPRRRAR
jgi:hypothetical protein